jgi:cleavage and polyadenylation specificity factor subunit 1
LRIEEEELEVYGAVQKVTTSVQLCTYIFEVCDSILNIGPIAHMAIGERAIENEVEPPPDVEQPQAKMDLEIVTASGYGKNGALCVLQSSIKPQNITSFQLPNCLDVWTVSDESAKKSDRPEDVSHAFMILSQPTSSMVLQTGEEINEIEKTGFATNLPTIFVGNVGVNRFIIQVTVKSIRLLQGIRLIQNIPIDLGYPLTTVSVSDPYVAIRAANGQVITLALREAKGAPRLAVNKNTIAMSPPVIGMSVYKDVSGIFTAKYEDVFDLTKGGGMAGGAHSSGYGTMKAEPHMKIEDEEDLLYGDNAFKMISMADMTLPSNTKNSDWWRRMMQAVKPTYWLLVTRDNGNLEIYSMPDLKLVYLVTNVGNGNKVLSDSMVRKLGLSRCFLVLQGSSLEGPEILTHFNLFCKN